MPFERTKPSTGSSRESSEPSVRSDVRRSPPATSASRAPQARRSGWRSSASVANGSSDSDWSPRTRTTASAPLLDRVVQKRCLSPARGSGRGPRLWRSRGVEKRVDGFEPFSGASEERRDGGASCIEDTRAPKSRASFEGARHEEPRDFIGAIAGAVCFPRRHGAADHRREESHVLSDSTTGRH